MTASFKPWLWATTLPLSLGIFTTLVSGQETPQTGTRTGKLTTASERMLIGTNLTPQQFAMEATWAGQKEIRLSEIALEKTRQSEVRDFAQMMIRDHTQANQKLRTLAQEKGYLLPPTNAFEQGRRYVREQTQPPTQGAAAEKQTETTAPPTTDNTNPERRSVPQREGDERSTTRTTDMATTHQEDLQAVQRLQTLRGPDFDRAFVSQMVEDHRKAIQLFQIASQNLTDNETKEYASDTLPKLREHYSHAQKLAGKYGAAPTREVPQEK